MERSNKELNAENDMLLLAVRVYHAAYIALTEQPHDLYEDTDTGADEAAQLLKLLEDHISYSSEACKKALDREQEWAKALATCSIDEIKQNLVPDSTIHAERVVKRNARTSIELPSLLLPFFLLSSTGFSSA